jgi:type IV fimbrial biogenesis protein FimT
MPYRKAGYSLFELVMTLALAAIVLTIGLPSFSGMVARSHQRVEIDALFHAIHLARKESIVRRRVVSLCPSFDVRAASPAATGPAAGSCSSTVIETSHHVSIPASQC